MLITELAFVAVFAPLVGFILSMVGMKLNRPTNDKKWGDQFAQIISCTFMFVAATAGILLLKNISGDHTTATISILPWISIENFTVSWGFKLDSLSVIMINVINFISFLIHIYSIGYMSHDSSIPRFMGYLSLFSFMMLMLVTAPNLLQLFFGWEGVGLASYLLIGFWYKRPSANAASMKAFLVNRVGDVGLVLGIAALFLTFNTIEFDPLFAKLAAYSATQSEVLIRPTLVFWGYQLDAITLIAFLLIVGAMGKSAQLGLHTWLPDAMEGPTPVSALIHAATMVTAGVFLICRLSPLYELAPLARDFLTIIGALTSLFAASIALTQTDIKRVIAYSTCSQLGYMMFAAGCSAYSAAMFHLVAHAFFKALLFLGAGSVIHALSDEQDMNKMGGVYRLIPFTYAVMWIGSIQLAAIPLFSFYQSKDTILEFSFLQGTPVGYFAFAIGSFVAFLTAFYSWRLLLLAFHGPAKADKDTMSHVHESPFSMLAPLAILALGAILSGHIGYSWLVGDNAEFFWNGSLVLSPLHHDIPMWVVWGPAICALIGVIVAYFLYGKDRQLSTRLSQIFSPLYAFLKNKWYIDELYTFLFVKRAFVGGALGQRIDKAVIDRFGPDGLAAVSVWTGRLTNRLQTGYVYHYAFAMIMGILFIITLFLQQNWGGTHAG